MPMFTRQHLGNGAAKAVPNNDRPRNLECVEYGNSIVRAILEIEGGV